MPASATVERTLVETAQTAGIAVLASEAVLRHVIVRDTLPQPLEIQSSTWGSEVENLSLIWNQWMGV